MNSRKVKEKNRRCKSVKKVRDAARPISYRLKCTKTANGLSHFVMYGDVDKKQSPM